MEDLVERDSLKYKKSSDVPFTGKTTAQKQGIFKDEVLDGPWVTYYENGELVERFSGPYKNGVKVE